MPLEKPFEHISRKSRFHVLEACQATKQEHSESKNKVNAEIELFSPKHPASFKYSWSKVLRIFEVIEANTLSEPNRNLSNGSNLERKSLFPIVIVKEQTSTCR